MSNALAIATVTETLVRVLGNSLSGSGVTGATVTKTRPDDTNNLPSPGVNVFLYQVSPNTAWRNADLPTRGPEGTLLRRPQAALDLYYLLTFYGTDATLDQQRLLGAVVRQLHAFPVLSRDSVVAAVSYASATQNGVPPYLTGSDLADQIDVVRFTPVNYSLEELSKLWSVFLKTDYVLSVAYAASVVLIETDDLPPASALPVLKPCLKAVPFSLTVIESVQPQNVQLSPPAQGQITLIGQNLDTADAVTFLTPGITDPIPGTIVSSSADQTQLVVELPDGLRPGINGVTLTRFSSLPSPPGASGRVIAQSNTSAFVLQPAVLSLTVSGPEQVSAVISPETGPSQKVTLVLNQIDPSPPGAPLAFELTGSPSSPPGALDFNTSFSLVGSTDTVSVPAGSYLARIRVDAAESRLETGASGGFAGPIVTIS